jgi:hypothetical protein
VGLSGNVDRRINLVPHTLSVPSVRHGMKIFNSAWLGLTQALALRTGSGLKDPDENKGA